MDPATVGGEGFASFSPPQFCRCQCSPGISMDISPSVDTDSGDIATMGPVANLFSPAARSEILGIIQRDREWKAVQTATTTLQEEVEKLKMQNLEMIERLKAAAASQDTLRSQVSSLEEVNATQRDDIKSLRAELIEAKDRYDRLLTDSNGERAALRAQVFGPETQHPEPKETVVGQETEISKPECQGFNSHSVLLQTDETEDRGFGLPRAGFRWNRGRGRGFSGKQPSDGWSVSGGFTPRSPSKAGDLSNFGKIIPRGRGRGYAGKQPSDGWSISGGSTPRPPSKAGDLSNFGKINKFGPVTVGPSSVWAGKKDAAKRDSTLSGVDSNPNIPGTP